MSRTTENGNLSGQNWIPDVPDLRSEGSNIYTLIDFWSHTKKQSEPHRIDRATRPHGRNFENLCMFKNLVLLCCADILPNHGYSVILGILAT